VGVLDYVPSLLRALGVTLWLSWLTLLIGGVGGTALALMRLNRYAALRWIALLYVELFRSVPILIILFFAYYAAPALLGIDISTFLAATLALSLHASALMSEVVRAGIASVHRGQWEAAHAASFSFWQIMRHVVGPQALRVIIPPSVGIYIMMLKETSIASIVGYVELTETGLLVRESLGGGFAVLIVVALLYFIVCYAISLAGGAVERRMLGHLSA
jgi:His/Glu/Gln/Arg/opine family amino acid ABC transporter permease subunit